MSHHAELPPGAAARAPYPVVDTPNGARIDLRAHPDAAFFAEATARLQQPSSGR